MVLQQKLDFSTMFMPAIQNQEFYDLGFSPGQPVVKYLYGLRYTRWYFSKSWNFRLQLVFFNL